MIHYEGGWSGLPHRSARVSAQSRGKARSMILARVLDAGYEARFTDIHVRRCAADGAEARSPLEGWGGKRTAGVDS